MAKHAGRDFLLYVKDGASFIEVAGCRETTETNAFSPADVTTKSSDGHREYLSGSGFIENRVSFSGVFTSGDAWDRLKAIQISLAPGEFELRYGDGTKGAGAAFVTSLARSSPYEGAQEFTGELLFSGGLVTSEVA